METTYLGNLNEAGTTNNNSGKSSCHLAILKRTSILDILNVVIMMRMTYTSLCNFYENVDMIMLRGICRHGGRKKVPRR